MFANGFFFNFNVLNFILNIFLWILKKNKAFMVCS